MRIEQVMFRSGPVRYAGDLYLPDGADGSMRAAGVVMGHSVIMVKEALAPHAEYLVQAGFVVLASRAAMPPSQAGGRTCSSDAKLTRSCSRRTAGRLRRRHM